MSAGDERKAGFSLHEPAHPEKCKEHAVRELRLVVRKVESKT